MNLQEKIVILGMTDTGKVRQKNEDSIGYDSALGLVVLADGMGGHRGGEVASSLAVDVIISAIQQQLSETTPKKTDSKSGLALESIYLRDAVRSANKQVFEQAETSPEQKGMGTTVVALLFHNGTLSLVHIGDSRCYRLRGSKLEQITKDHSLLQELVDRGFYTSEEAQKSVKKNLVTRALGIEQDVKVDLLEDIVLKKDIYLLCSDGLTDLIEDTDIYLTINKFSDNLEKAAMQLITMANQKGGKDNISVMLCRVDEDFSTRMAWFRKMIAWFD
jgi:serine/threonine protein phosphatase PrpC